MKYKQWNWNKNSVSISKTRLMLREKELTRGIVKNEKMRKYIFVEELYHMYKHCTQIISYGMSWDRIVMIITENTPFLKSHCI